jgi:hypothetical protein
MRFAVDPAAVLAQAKALERVRGVLVAISRPDTGQVITSILGSAVVARALHEATGNWSQARARVDAELHATAEAAAVAATAYDEVEGNVLRAACGGAG